MAKKKLKITTIGGGSGMPIINQSLIMAGFDNISSIVTTFDNGGDSGRLRTDERGNLLAMSDYWRALVSLWKDGEKKKIWVDVLRFRDGKERNLGNSFFRFLSEKNGDLLGVDDMFCKLTGAQLGGQVIPVSSVPSQVCFETRFAKIFKGEQKMDEQRMSLDQIKKIWLEPNVEANKEAIMAIKAADFIIVCPGSIYGSVLVNFLPLGMKKAFQTSVAKKYLFTNLVNVPNESFGYNEQEYLNLFVPYLGKNPFDKVILPDLDCLNRRDLNKALASYANEHSFPINYKKLGKPFLVQDIAAIEKDNYRLRHSPEKLAKLLKYEFDLV